MKEYKRVDKVLEYHKNGYNCAQAVACAYCEDFGVDKKTTLGAMESFGGGMAMESVCGAVSAMAYLAGLKLSDRNTESPASKKITYEAMRQMIREFRDMNQSVICSEIKGTQTGKVLRSCPGCMEDAASIVEKVLFRDMEY